MQKEKPLLLVADTDFPFGVIGIAVLTADHFRSTTRCVVVPTSPATVGNWHVEIVHGVIVVATHTLL